MNRTVNRLLSSQGRRLVRPLLLTVLIATTPRAFSQTFFVSIEPPGVDHQQSPLFLNGINYGAQGVNVEDFERSSLIANQVQTFNFNNNADIGNYTSDIVNAPGRPSNGLSGALVKSADRFGGAGGTGKYMTVNIATAANSVVSGGPSAPATTITFVHPQRYFGLWWSAGDPNNVLEFFSGNTLLQTYTTNFVTNFINGLPNHGGYGGNPNGNVGGPNNNPNENYAFLNFFADPEHPTVTFDKVILTNSLTTGFESDNHTIAESYTDVTGEEIPGPQPPIEPGPGEIVRLGPGTIATEHGGGHLGGTLVIDQGAILILSGDKTVDPPGDLEGDGMIMTPDLENNGTTTPMGEEPGTPGDLIVIGDYNQRPGGTLQIGIAGEQCPDGSRLVVTGTATLTGTLRLVSLNNAHATSGSHYTVLIAFRGINGFFSNVTDTFNTSGLTRADIAAPNGVVVAYLPPGHGVVTLRSAIAIPFDNPCDVDAVLLSALAPNAEQLAVPFDIWFSLAQTQRFNLQAHLDDIMAEPVPAVPYTTPPPSPKEVVVGKGVISGKEPLPAPVSERHWNLWATGYGNWVDINSQGLAKGYNYTTGGVTVGADYRFLDHYVVGLTGGYAHTWADLKPGSVDINTGWGGLYAGYFNRGFYVLGAAFGGGNGVDSSRPTVVGGRAHGSADSQEWSTFLSAGYDFHCGQLTIGPIAAVQYSYVNLDGFTEASSFAALRVHENSEESLRSDLGFRAWYIFQAGQIGLRPFVRAAWQHEYKQSRLPVTASLVDISGPGVTVFGPSLGHDSAVVNAGVSVQWTPTISTYVSYDGQLGRDRYDSNGVSGGFNVTF